MSRRTLWAVLTLQLLTTTGLAAEDWPQWRGPSGLGVSAESNLPTSWSVGKNVAWKVRLRGLGASSPIVWGDRVFLTSQVGRAPLEGESHPGLARQSPEMVAREKPIGGARGEADEAIFLVVEAFNRIEGRRLWEHRMEATGPLPRLHEKHNLASSTPVTDGERVYAWFGTGQLVALDMQGRVVWARHLGQEYSPFDINWGHGSSPVLHDGLLILLCDHSRSSYLLALDARTGRERWKVDRGRGLASYSTPLIVPTARGAELIINSSERIDAYDPATGRFLWHAGEPRRTPVPSPIFHDSVVYLSRGYRSSPYLAIRTGGRGNVSASHVEWQSPSGAAYTSSLVHYRGLLYMTNDIGVLTCADAKTGKRVWQTRLDGIFFASPVAGDGKLYLVSETGETLVLRAGRKPEILARNDLGERFLASPAISNGQIFLRSDGTLFSIGTSQR